MILGRLETALARSSHLRRRAEALAPPWGLTRARARWRGARARGKFTVRAGRGVELTARARVGIYCARGEGEFTIGITGARSQELALASALPCPEKITNSGSQKSVPEIQPNPTPSLMSSTVRQKLTSEHFM